MALEAVIEALGGGRQSRGSLPPGVPESDRAAFTYVNEATKQGRPATAAPTPGGGLDVITQGSERPADLRAQESANDGPLAGAIQALSAPTKIEAPKPVSQVPAPSNAAPEDTSWTGRIKTGVDAVRKALPGVVDSPISTLDTALTAGTGMVAAPIAAVGGMASNIASGKFRTPEGVQIARDRAKEILESLTYQPRTAAGKENVAALGSAMEASKLQGLDPGQMNTLASVAAGPRAAKVAPKVAGPEVLGPRAMGSVGAAAASEREMALAAASNASPETRQIVEELVKKKQPIDLAALNRHVEADSLPVKVPLTQGQASQDVGVLSTEQNARGKNEALRERFNQQNKALVENTNRIRENAAPDVYAQSKPEHGELLIDAYNAKDAALNKVISEKYAALKEANGGEFPLDAKALVSNVDAKLHKELKYDFLPAEYRKTLDRLADSGSMTFENFESLRTNLARTMRSQTADGNAKAAAAIVRDALEELPMPKGAEHLKPLADEARAAARERFAMLEADPAYKAVVRGSISADKFIDKYVLNADLKDVKKLMESLPPEQRQVVASGVVNHLKASAGIIGNEGNFSQAGYNRALEKLRPKLEILFAPEQRKQVEALGNVARYTQAQPRGSFVNNSNTLVGSLAEAGKSAAEGAVNVAAGGVPIGSWFRKYAKLAAERKQLNESLRPGAGILLRNVGK